METVDPVENHQIPQQPSITLRRIIVITLQLTKSYQRIMLNTTALNTLPDTYHNNKPILQMRTQNYTIPHRQLNHRNIHHLRSMHTTMATCRMATVNSSIRIW